MYGTHWQGTWCSALSLCMMGSFHSTPPAEGGIILPSPFGRPEHLVLGAARNTLHLVALYKVVRAATCHPCLYFRPGSRQSTLWTSMLDGRAGQLPGEFLDVYQGDRGQEHHGRCGGLGEESQTVAPPPLHFRGRRTGSCLHKTAPPWPSWTWPSGQSFTSACWR